MRTRNPDDLSARLLSGDVAQILGVSAEMVRKLDAELLPARTTRGVRIYSRQVVEAYAARRAGRRQADELARSIKAAGR